MTRRTVLLTAFALALAVCQSWGVVIETPGGYTRVREYPLVISNTDPRGLLKVVVNGFPMVMKAYDSFRVLTLGRGLNSIVASPYYTNRPNAFGDQSCVTVFADVPPVALKVIHTWDTGDNYVDVYIVEPTGEECFYGHRNTQLGGVMDIGSDTIGYGPQIYTMPFPNPGVYKIYVKYYEGSSSRMTEITTHVVLNEGTSREVRKTFQAVLTAPGERIAVGQIEIK